ncbi:minor capsid protein [Dubosiella newyorkensis]|uniref:minor capsid protein n=1 Tax=Dubosiella newyorkensis TaxID=1862672 RepID=UPI00272BE567|nr:minor capsid protein [Dubosiella newyorkensis]
MAKPESKSSADYWREREEEQRKHNIQEEKTYSQEIERIYRQMMNEIEIQINNFYTRYATKEGITYAEAKKRVSKLDIKTYAELAKKYVAEKNFSDQANEEMRLYNLTMKVNRLELLKANIGMHLVGGFDELQRFFEEKLTKRTIETFKRQAGILGRTVHDNARYAHSIVNASFHNATWSDRIWKHQDILRNELGNLLSTGLIQGRNPKELARTLRKKIKSSVYDANRLMITEMARVQTEAQRRSFEENGFDQYTFHSLGTACPHCLAINGKHFGMEDMRQA